MALFKRQRDVPSRDAKVAFPPLVVHTEDLPQADKAVSAFIAAVGNDPRMRMCARDLSLLGGAPRSDNRSVQELADLR
jgi:hypothetical protein